MTPVTESELKAHQEKIGGKRVTLDALKANIAKEEFHVFPGSQLTVCVLTLQNGFTVTGESACADPTMFNEEIGQKIARENAERHKPHVGYGGVGNQLFHIFLHQRHQGRDCKIDGIGAMNLKSEFVKKA